jgi:hypothetical protein
MKSTLLCLLPLACAHATPSPNDTFRAAYREARARALAAAGPVLLVDGDQLLLIDGARRERATIRDGRYHALKEAAHAPLGVFAALCDIDGPLPPDRLPTLRALRLAMARLGPAAASAQTELDAVLAQGTSRQADLAAWARAAGPALLAAAGQAAELERAALETATSGWQAALGERFARVHVIVIGSHMAREGELALTFFLARLGESAEGGRVIYAESLWEEGRALELLGTHLIDGQAAAAFFGDPRRLHRDVLAP